MGVKESDDTPKSLFVFTSFSESFVPFCFHVIVMYSVDTLKQWITRKNARCHFVYSDVH